MALQEIDVSTTTSAVPAAVWALLADSTTVVERTRERRPTYVLLAGLAVRDDRAEIDLVAQEAGQGAAIRWHTTFRAKVPGTGWLDRRALERATRTFVDRLAHHAARPA